MEKAELDSKLRELRKKELEAQIYQDKENWIRSETEKLN